MAIISLRHGDGRRALVELIQSYRHLDDNDRHAADIETTPLAAEMVQDSNTLDLERDVHQLGAAVSRRMTDKLNLSLAYRYAGSDPRMKPTIGWTPRTWAYRRGWILTGTFSNWPVPWG